MEYQVIPRKEIFTFVSPRKVFDAQPTYIYLRTVGLVTKIVFPEEFSGVEFEVFIDESVIFRKQPMLNSEITFDSQRMTRDGRLIISYTRRQLIDRVHDNVPEGCFFSTLPDMTIVLHRHIPEAQSVNIELHRLCYMKGSEVI